MSLSKNALLFPSLFWDDLLSFMVSDSFAPIAQYESLNTNFHHWTYRNDNSLPEMI